MGQAETPTAPEDRGAEEISSGLLSAVIPLMPDAAIVVDSQGIVTAANSRAEEMFGFEPGCLVGQQLEVLVPEGLRQRHRGHRAAYAKDPATRPMGVGLELAGRRTDGSEIPVDISLAPLAGGLVVASVRDMTEQRAASAAQAELATIVRSSLDGIISTTREGQVTNWNPAATALLGYEPEEMLGRHLTNMVPPESQTDLDELLDAAFAFSLVGGKDTEWVTKAGERVPLAVSASPLLGDDGGVRGFSFIVRDIRERKAAEAELRRLLAEERRLERQHAATAEIRLALLSGRDLHDSLTLICEQAVELLGADMATVVLRDEGPTRIVAGAGIAPSMLGMEFPLEGTLADAVIAEERLIAADHRSEISKVVLPDQMPNGPVLGVPVLAAGRVQAALALARHDGEPAFSNAEQVFAEVLAAQAALAIELERAEREREKLMLVGDRERIGRDLHDHVIQQLFAAGLGLQSLLSLVERPEVRERVSEAVEALDETIRQIRNTIFELSAPAGTTSLLRLRALEMTKEIEGALGFAPTLRFVGPIDTAVPERIVPHVLAVLREGLSNAARHSGASKVEVVLEVGVELLSVTVNDNGVGMSEGARQSGLANLAERCRLLGGQFAVERREEGGTRLFWQVPLGS